MDLPHFPRTSNQDGSKDPAAVKGGSADADVLFSTAKASCCAFPHDAHGHARASYVDEFCELKDSLTESLDRLKEHAATTSLYDKAAFFLPCLGWLRGYKIKEWLVWDLLAGITVGFMVVPQGMSYALLAGVPAVYGLYGAFVPVLVYSLFGSSKQLGVGPVAVTSLLIANGVQQMVPYSSWLDLGNPVTPLQQEIQNSYNIKVSQLAFVVSLLYTGVGLLRLGWVVRFLSHSVITGFTSGAAFIIAASQVKYIVGYSVPRMDTFHENIKVLVAGIEDFQWREFVMGILMIVWLVGLRLLGKWKPKLFWISAMGPISACFIGIIVVVGGKYYNNEIKIVGKIPAGMPPLTVYRWLPIENVPGMMKLAAIVMLVDLLESTSIARALARKNGYQLVYNREIIGLGLANFFGAMFSCYTTTGSFSRSAVNNASGAKSQLAGFFTSIVVMLVLLFLTPVFSKLPYNVIGAIIIVGVCQLIEFGVAWHLFKTHIRDFLVWLTAFICTLFLGVELGLGISIGLALLIIVFESAFPHTAVLGSVNSSNVYRSIEQYPDAKVVPGVLVARLDAPAYFANVQWFQDKLQEYEEDALEIAKAHGLDQLQYVILEMSPVTRIDAMGITFLEELLNDYRKRGIQLVLSNPTSCVQRTMDRAGFTKHLGRQWIFVCVQDAVINCSKLQAMEGGGVPNFVDPIRKVRPGARAAQKSANVDAIVAKAIDNP